MYYIYLTQIQNLTSARFDGSASSAVCRQQTTKSSLAKIRIISFQHAIVSKFYGCDRRLGIKALIIYKL